MTALIETELTPLTLYARGKVRDLYSIGDQLLLVATDRISAFDHVLATGIPGKGKVLTQLSLFWFDFLKDVVPNHLITADINRYPQELAEHREELEGRSMLVKRAQMFPSNASFAAISPGPAGRITRPLARSAESACPPACANRISCLSRFSRQQAKARMANTTSISHSTTWWRA